MSSQHGLVASATRKFKFVIASGGFLIDVCCIWPFIFCAFSFGLFFAIHPNSRDKVEGHRQIPTLSQTGKLVPESLFFTFGLHTEAMLLAFLFTFVYVHFKNKINAIALSQQQPLIADPDRDVDDEECSMVDSYNARRPQDPQCCESMNYFCCCLCKSQASRETDVKFLEFWNRALIVLGLIATLLMALVGSVTLDVEETVHGTIAFFMFLTAILHMLFFYFTIAETMGYTTFQINLVRLCLFVCIPFNIIMMVAIGLMYVNCDGDEICEQAAIDFMPSLEYSTTIGLLGYVYSFREDLKDINILTMAAVSQRPVSGLSDANVNEDTSANANKDSASDASDSVSQLSNGSVYNPPRDGSNSIHPTFSAEFNLANVPM